VAFGFVTRHVYEEVVASIKQQCIEAVNQFIIELQFQFPNQDLIGVVYFPY
jgi:hypothetical protein